jgi:hypothetical protein
MFYFLFMFVSTDYIDPEFAPEQTEDKPAYLRSGMFAPQTKMAT